MYVDGFVAAVPNANKETYRKHAEEAWSMFKRYGAQKMVECWGSDVPEGKVTSFRMAVQQKEDETVVFSWITWPDKATRDKGWADMQTDDQMKMDMPFDGKRMIYGGFDVLVNAN